MEKRHAIILIKNNEGKYLQVFENSWNSYLFLNCKVNDENDTNSIYKYIEEKLGVKPNKIEYKFDKVHTKFSEKDKIDKEYHHYFYIVDIDLDVNSNEFEIYNNRFKWYSYDELLNDERIMLVNSDIVGFIKDIN